MCWLNEKKRTSEECVLMPSIKINWSFSMELNHCDCDCDWDWDSIKSIMIYGNIHQSTLFNIELFIRNGFDWNGMEWNHGICTYFNEWHWAARRGNICLSVIIVNMWNKWVYNCKVNENKPITTPSHPIHFDLVVIRFNSISSINDERYSSHSFLKSVLHPVFFPFLFC